MSTLSLTDWLIVLAPFLNILGTVLLAVGAFMTGLCLGFQRGSRFMFNALLKPGSPTRTITPYDETYDQTDDNGHG